MPILTWKFNPESVGPNWDKPWLNVGENLVTKRLGWYLNSSDSMSALEADLFGELMKMISESSSSKYEISLIPGENGRFEDDLDYGRFEKKLRDFMESGEKNLINIEYRMQLLSEKWWNCSYDEKNKVLKISHKSDNDKWADE